MRYSSFVLSISLVCGLASPAIVATALAATAPPVSLAQLYRDEIDLTRYWVSEKYDGARTWWNGTHLLSRNGNIFHAPDWFTKSLPATVLDGELWIGRGQFQLLMQTIRDSEPDDNAWRQVKFLVFDAPQAKGDFTSRQQALADLFNQHSVDWLQLVNQRRVADKQQLQQWLDQVVASDGEGLILQRGDSSYQAGRHSGLLKLKTSQDAEAVVVGYIPGKGKYTGMTGSLQVVDASGRRFRLGSGLSDEQRRNPPPIGTLVSYRFQGRTNSGKPRFARFLRVRPTE